MYLLFWSWACPQAAAASWLYYYRKEWKYPRLYLIALFGSQVGPLTVQPSEEISQLTPYFSLFILASQPDGDQWSPEKDRPHSLVGELNLSGIPALAEQNILL